MSRIDECLERAELSRRRAAEAPDHGLRELHLNRAALWQGMADLLRADAAREYVELLYKGIDDPAADAEQFQLYLRTAAPQGTA